MKISHAVILLKIITSETITYSELKSKTGYSVNTIRRVVKELSVKNYVNIIRSSIVIIEPNIINQKIKKELLIKIGLK